MALRRPRNRPAVTSTAMTDGRRLVLVIAAGLAACTVGPDYRKPAVDAPASFQYLPRT